MAIIHENIFASPSTYAVAISTLKSWQWVRYGIAGVLSAVVDLSIFFVLATCVLPCIDSGIGDDGRAFRFVINKTVAFLIANGFSYWLNAHFVFTPGRLSRFAELGMFFGISSLSYLVGAQLAR